MASPRPVPPAPLLARANGRKSSAARSSGMPGALVGHLEHDPLRRRRSRARVTRPLPWTSAFASKLETTCSSRSSSASATTSSADLDGHLPPVHRCEASTARRARAPSRDRSEVQREHAPAQPGELEQVLHEPSETLRLRARDLEKASPLVLGRGQVFPLERAQEADCGGERRPELVGDVGDELLAQLRELLHPLHRFELTRETAPPAPAPRPRARRCGRGAAGRRAPSSAARRRAGRARPRPGPATRPDSRRATSLRPRAGSAGAQRRARFGSSTTTGTRAPITRRDRHMDRLRLHRLDAGPCPLVHRSLRRDRPDQRPARRRTPGRAPPPSAPGSSRRRATSGSARRCEARPRRVPARARASRSDSAARSARGGTRMPRRGPSTITSAVIVRAPSRSRRARGRGSWPRAPTTVKKNVSRGAEKEGGDGHRPEVAERRPALRARASRPWRRSGTCR